MCMKGTVRFFAGTRSRHNSVSHENESSLSILPLDDIYINWKFWLREQIIYINDSLDILFKTSDEISNESN